MSVDEVASENARSRVAWWIQVAANAAVFAAAIGVLWIAFHRGTNAGGHELPIYSVGEKIDPVGQVDFRKSPKTLVMFIRENCTYCQRSLPFYERLTAAVKVASAQSLRLVVASTDQEQGMAAYLKANRISVDEIANVGPDALKIPGTPALLLVDSDGVVTKVWRGWLSPDKEREVFTQLGLQIVP